jgi:hypothetical protein
LEPYTVKGDSMTSEVLYESPPLFPPDVVAVTLRVGVIRSQDHLQWLLEARNATDDVLLAMESTPHRALAQTPQELVLMYEQLGTMLYNLTGPF